MSTEIKNLTGQFNKNKLKIYWDSDIKYFIKYTIV